MKKYVLALAILAVFCAAAYADAQYQDFDNSSAIAAKYLSIGDSAAAAGMGNAYLGVANDSCSIFWNPAGLANMQRAGKEWNIFFNQNIWLQDTMASSISIAKNVKQIGTFGLGVFYFNAGSITKSYIDSNGNPIPSTDTYSPYSMVINAAYSTMLEEGLDFGFNLKYIIDTINTDMTSALAFDIGVRYHFPFLKDLTLNIVAKNFGGRLNRSTLAKEMDFAAAYSINISDYVLTTDYDICGMICNLPVQRVGLEIKTPFLLVLRAGYQSDNTTVDGFKNFTFGGGININNKFADFSYEPFGDLGSAYKFSFGGDF